MPEFKPEIPDAWREVARELESGRVLSKKDLTLILSEFSNYRPSRVASLIKAINSGGFTNSTEVPVAILVMGRYDQDITVRPFNPAFDVFNGSPRFYMDSRLPVELTDLWKSVLRSLTSSRPFTIKLRQSGF